MTRSLFLLLSLSLSLTLAGQTLAAGTTAATDDGAIRQQLDAQGRMLLGTLREAREAGLRGDRWGMDYALQEATRLNQSLRTAQRLEVDRLAGGAGASHPSKTGPTPAPLEERLDIDSPLPGDRWQRLGELQQAAGSIPLASVQGDVNLARQALHGRRPALGAALLATNRAIETIQWHKSLEPRPWADVRDRVLKAYALILDGHPRAVSELRASRDRLGRMPGGAIYAGELDRLLQAPAPDLPALSALVRKLDAKVESLRDKVERTHLEGASPQPASQGQDQVQPTPPLQSAGPGSGS